MFSEVGDSALVILVPEAEPIVGEWRASLDPAAAEGMPAHVTVLYPFIPAPQIDDHVLDDIRHMCQRHKPIVVKFSAVGEFPGVVWLDPGSNECARLLEDARVTWPDQLPYGRSDLKVVPHLTITDGADANDAERAKASVRKQLPFMARIESLALMAYDGLEWVIEQQFAFGPHAPD
jgi:2'-5' RNA ligase